MQKLVFPIWKDEGQTPLEAIALFKLKFPKYKTQTVSYAGRLDPMAEGLLLLLIGDENKNRKRYEDMEKEYIAEICLGISTDTFDALGIVQDDTVGELKYGADFGDVLRQHIGKKTQEYPPYSSKPVNGKPLYWWSRNNRLSEIELPTKDIEIYAIDLLSEKKLSLSHLVEDIAGRIKKVTGDFRQDAIVARWEDFARANPEAVIMVIKLRIVCSSGAYVRKLASDIGNQLGCGAFALTIVRTRIGDFKQP